jgi:enamine deaminase RidA (YjgF/YER057c/UK114 family)
VIPIEFIDHLPAVDGSPRQQARESLAFVRSRLEASGRGTGHVLALTFFVDAAGPVRYRELREQLAALVGEVFAGTPPPTAVIAQAPEGERCVGLEAKVLAAPADDVSVSRKACEGATYTLVRAGALRQVHGGGRSSCADGDDTATRAREAFEEMEAILRAEGLTFGHVVRQWSYIEGILEVRNSGRRDHQAYQAFNDVRSQAYGRSSFPAGYPAATGIGQSAGGVALEFIALDSPADVRVEPLSSPRQIDAHRYSAGVLVGAPLEDRKTAPKFERAKRVRRGDDETVLVSGTAAILGEQSVAPGDVSMQTATSIENIAAVVEGGKLSHLRAYVKRRGDIPIVRTICEAAYGGIPALYVQADVCRDELLVELEGALVNGPGGPGGHG